MRRIAAIALGTWLGLLGCASTPLYERPWLEVRTPNFAILSPLARAQVVELAVDLERFRKVVEGVTGETIPPSPVPVRVFAFGDASAYRPFSESEVSGYVRSGMREVTIVVGPERRDLEAREILQHEYVHFLLRNRGVYAYPPWYDEGFAEFLSTVALRQGKVEIGRPVPLRVESLRFGAWLPLEEVIERRNFEGLSADQRAAFYAESWGLVHYLYFGREPGRTRDELTRYLKALKGGTSNEEAVRLAFGDPSGGLGHLLRQYLTRGKFPYATVDAEPFDVGAEPEASALAAPAVARALGELSTAIGKPDQAKRFYEACLAASPRDARCLSGLALALGAQQRWDEAEARTGEALAAAADDAAIQLDAATYLRARAEATADPDERDRLARRARRHYVASWKLDGSIPETYAGYGATFLLDGQEASRGRETLEHAHDMLPSSPEIKLSLAQLYARLGRHADARELALVISTWSHSQQMEAEIRSILGDDSPPE